jgi:hypothetical protein
MLHAPRAGCFGMAGGHCPVPPSACRCGRYGRLGIMGGAMEQIRNRAAGTRPWPVLRRPLRPGEVTVREYARKIGHTPEYVQNFWKPLDGFPDPLFEKPSAGRHGGGRGELVYSEAALDDFRFRYPRLWGYPSVRLVLGHHLDERVSLTGFADVTGLDVPARAGDPGPPAAGADGLHRLGDLVTWHNNLAGPWPALAVTPLGPGEHITLPGFARLVNRHRKTVSQYRATPGFPGPEPDGRYRLGKLASWWNNRPGKRPPRPAG